MIKQLRKVGNSRALLLDKAILELLGLSDDGQVQLVVNEGSLIVTPVQPAHVDKDKFQACMERVMKRRKPLLRRLAK
ncbi:MAG: MazE family transcriptional regulator [Planctomycetales bacterium]|nr:MazE family transcriptional regulator [Planctomycetales bacterium]